MKRILLTTVLLLSFLFQGNAQRFDYENTAKLFFGVNIGRTWHTSDVENVTKRFPLGAGFIFGGSINQDYGNAVSFDIRFRYLGGNWYGQDTDTTSAIQNNKAVHALYDTLGYTVQNFKATQHRLSLELSIHANRFKERTGFDPYIFAGIGVTSTRTKGDLLQKTGTLSSGTIYPYNQSPNGNIIDKDYTVALDKNESGDPYENDRFEANILPSLGVGIGYYVNNRLSIGIEHKSTFFLADYFDGTTLNQDGMPSDKFKNDIYHYSGLYLKWYFKAGNTNRVPPKDDAYVPPTHTQNPIIEDEPVTTDPARKRPPIVTFNNPASSPMSTNNPSFAIRASVQYVSNASNLTFTRNGANHNTFIFNPMTRLFESTVNLEIGENVFTLTGVNADGSDSDRVVIIYERTADDRTNPPVVNIVDPAVRPHTVNQLNYIVKADIQNISARNQLVVTFNEQTFSDFSFTPSGNINFNANLSLNAGVNTFKIVGTNKAGMDLDETVIIYTRDANENTGYPPTVKITTPSTNPYTTTKSIESVVAKIENINTTQQLEVKINGVSTTNFTYNNATKRVQFNANLSVGTNTIVVNAINPYGNGTDKTQIILRRGGSDTGDTGVPPKVKILAPNVNPFNTDQATTNIIAEVNNIDSKSQIEVKVNGVITNNFTYNNATHLVQLSTGLVLGNNIVSIKATNVYGNDIDQIQIIYRRGGTGINDTGAAPKVKITTPSISPFTTEQAAISVLAEVNNVISKSQLEVKVNGSNTTNFTFNAISHQVQLNMNLILGNNSVSIKATNEYGSDIDDTQIIYRRGGIDSGETGTPPKVNVVRPNTNPYTTELGTVDVVAQVLNITSKQQVEVKVNGVITSDFTYNHSTKWVQLTTPLSAGSNIVSFKATNVYGTDAAETQIILRKPIVGKPPVVSFITPNEDYRIVELPYFKMIAKTENVAKKSDVNVYFNGSLVNPNDYTFNPSMQTVQYGSNLIYGENTYLVNAKNNFGTHQATEKIERKRKALDEAEGLDIKEQIKLPCAEPTMLITSPTNETSTTETSSIHVQGHFQNIDNAIGIKVFFNGKRDYAFIYNGVTKSFSHKLDLKEGENTYQINLTNSCGTFEKEFIIHYQAPQACGVKIDLGTVQPDFCLLTTSGTVSRSDLLSNTSFEYKGIAKILYFKAGENGTITVNGADFPILKDNFYYFAEGATVDIGRNKPGSIGQWNICIDAVKPPLYGSGRSKPKSPCESANSKQPDTNDDAPIIEEKPELQGTPKPTIREKPTRNNKENTTPIGEPAKPGERTPINPRNPRNPRGGS
ncbi:MAG TPA: hypothetical protein VFD77_02355 [Brumimicrobium sp.]|nr:hypothetical protein [Brumimicrobium sp.]